MKVRASVAKALAFLANTHPGLRPNAEMAQIWTATLAGLNYNIEIHLPATKYIEVFNAIFKSLK